MASILSVNSRPLLLATAGHVNHGKTFLIEKLTGINPDRLPEEKKRGMTLDLGFAHAPEFSFIDCPGHEGLVRHLIAGQTSVDGALFIVASDEGLQEQSREHARILNWLGVERILVVFTKADLVSPESELNSLAQDALEELKSLLNSKTQIDKIFSRRTDDAKLLKEKILHFFKTESPSPTHHHFGRFFIDRAFTLKGIGTVITGTFSEGKISLKTRASLWSPVRPKIKFITLKSLKRNQARLEECFEKSRLAIHIDGASPSEIPRGSCLILNSDDEFLTDSFILDISWATKIKKQFTALLQIGTLTTEVKLRLHPKGFWRAKSKIPIPIKLGDKIVIRVPNRIENLGHVIGGGTILDEELYLPKAQAKTKSPAQVSMSKPAPIDATLLSFIFNNKWRALIDKEDLDKAHNLVKNNLAFHIGENQFIHKDYYDELLKWLNLHFKTHEDLHVEDARSFFGTGRRSLISILEFCDRLHFTYRKGDGRRRFKLPPYSRPVVAQPCNEHGGDRPIGPRLY